MTRTKKAIAMLAALVLTVSLAAPALALGEIDLGHGGTFYVKVDEIYAEDLASYHDGAKVPVDLYLVATVNEHGAFTLVEPFTGLAELDAWDDGIVLNGTDDGKANVEALLAAALEVVQPEGEDGESAVPVTKHADLDPMGGEGGQIAVDQLGLYLVVPRTVQTVLWVYQFSPTLLAVPSIERERNESDDVDMTDGTWQYDVPLFLKGERVRRMMDLQISKELLTYNRTLGPVTFVFEVTGTLVVDGVEKVSYLNTAEITFTDDTSAQQVVTLHDIPAGSVLTVTEVYSGTSYHVKAVDGGGIAGAQTGSNSVSFEISELTLPEGQDVHRVGFTNDYTGERIPNTNVENVFTADGETHWTFKNNNLVEGGNG